MYDTDARIMTIERVLKTLSQSVRDLLSRIARAEQNQVTGGGGGGSGGGGGTFIAYPTSMITTGSSASTAVFMCQSGVQTSVGTYALYNYLPSPIAAGDGSSTFGVMCLPDGAGTYTAISQSCS